MSDHALLSPSSSRRWVLCPGSKEGNRIDSPSSEAAEEGTRVHEAAAGVLCRTLARSGYRDGVAGMLAVDEDWLSLPPAAQQYVRFVVENNPGHVASHVGLEELLMSQELPDVFFGTVDALLVDIDFLHVVDLKTGRRPVSAEDNYQLKSYLCLARENYTGRAQFFGTIVQDGPETVEFGADELDEHWERIKHAAASDERHAGEHCEFCPLLKTCETAREWAFKTADIVFDDVSEPTVDECKQIIGLEPVVKQMAESARHTLKEVMLRGESVAGWKLVQPLGNRSWKDEDALVAALQKEGLPSDALYKRSILTPNQMEAIIKHLGHGKDFLGPFVLREVKEVAAAPERSRLREYQPDVSSVFDVQSEV